MIIEAIGLDRFQARHPIVLSVLEELAYFGFRHASRGFHLFDQGKLCVLVEAVAGQKEVLVEFSSLGAVHIATVRIDAFVGCWFAFSNILRFRAKGTMAQVYEILASAI